MLSFAKQGWPKSFMRPSFLQRETLFLLGRVALTRCYFFVFSARLGRHAPSGYATRGHWAVAGRVWSGHEKARWVRAGRLVAIYPYPQQQRNENDTVKIEIECIIDLIFLVLRRRDMCTVSIFV